jgi:hypothetical protein
MMTVRWTNGTPPVVAGSAGRNRPGDEIDFMGVIADLDPIGDLFYDDCTSVYEDCVGERVPDDEYIARLEGALADSRARIAGKLVVLLFVPVSEC